MELLWDYENRQLRELLIHYLSYVGERSRQATGVTGVNQIHQYVADMGIVAYQKYTDDKGRQFFVN